MTRALLLLTLTLLLSACGKGGASDGSGGLSAPSVQLVNNRAFLTWSAASGMPDGYLIEQSTDNATWTQVATVPETSAYIDGLTAGTKYWFRLRSFNSAGNSAYSAPSSISL